MLRHTARFFALAFIGVFALTASTAIAKPPATKKAPSSYIRVEQKRAPWSIHIHHEGQAPALVPQDEATRSPWSTRVPDGQELNRGPDVTPVSHEPGITLVRVRF